MGYMARIGQEGVCSREIDKRCVSFSLDQKRGVIRRVTADSDVGMWQASVKHRCSNEREGVESVVGQG